MFLIMNISLPIDLSDICKRKIWPSEHQKWDQNL